jgi:hypothetical protein
MYGVIYQGESITKSMQVPTEQTLEVNCQQGEEYLVTEDSLSSSTHWISEGKPMPKTDFPEFQYISDVSIGAPIKISRIPLRTTVLWPDGYSSLEQDGELSTTATVAQPMVFTFYNDRYFTQEITINVSP